MKYLGVDWGEKRIGLALADDEIRLATPFKVVSNVNEIAGVVKKEKVNMIIVGKPLKMQDAKLEVQKEFLVFYDLLKEKIDMPIKTVDERLSSKAVDALVGDNKTKAPRDAVAAMLILQSYLDKI